MTSYRLRKERFGFLYRDENENLFIIDENEKLPNHIQKVYLENNNIDFAFTRPFISPIEVKWDITYTCNLSCIHCYSSSGKDGFYGISTNECKKIIDKLDEIGVFGLQLLGGEPLCRNDIIEILKYGKAKGLRITLNTNGTLLSESICNELKNICVDFVQMGIDGIGKTHDVFRGTNGSFKKALSGLRYLVNSDIQTGIVCVLNTSNFDELEKIINFCRDEGIFNIQFLSLMCTGRGDTIADKMLNREQSLSCISYINIAKSTYKDILIDAPGLGLDFGDDSIRELSSNDESNLIYRYGCKAGIYFIELDPYGNIGICVQSKDRFGNILDGDVFKIFEAIYKYKSTYSPEECVNCKNFLLSCWGHCFIRR